MGGLPIQASRIKRIGVESGIRHSAIVQANDPIRDGADAGIMRDNHEGLPVFTIQTAHHPQDVATSARIQASSGFVT
jgi:hypothetical protein